MKSLRPSMKERKRYLLLQGSGKIKGKNLQKKTEDAILSFIGVLGLSKCGLSWIKGKKDILCINRKMVDSVRASLCASPEKIDVVKVSGTLKGLGKK